MTLSQVIQRIWHRPPRTLGGSFDTPPKTLLTDLISCWKLDEASGNALDSHGTNDLTETSGTIGSAEGGRDFEAGDTEWFELADNSDFSIGDVSCTFSAQIKLESVGAHRPIVAKDDNNNNREYLLYMHSGNLVRFVVWSGATGNGMSSAIGPSLTNNVWYTVIGWHDAANNQVCIQVNNGGVYGSPHQFGIYNGSAKFQIGGSTGDVLYFDGIIKNVCFWKRTLSSRERTAIFDGAIYEDFGDIYFFDNQLNSIAETVWTYPTRTLVIPTHREFNHTKSLHGETDTRQYALGSSVHGDTIYFVNIGGETYQVTLSEAYKLGETLLSRLILDLAPTDTYKLSDTQSSQLNAIAQFVDAYKLSETLDPQLDILDIILNALKYGDAYNNQISIVESTSNGLEYTDSFNSLLAYVSDVTNGLQIGSSFVPISTIQTQIADAYELSDTYSDILVLISDQADAYELSDTQTVNVTGYKEISDGYELTDTVTTRLDAVNSLTNVIQYNDLESARVDLVEAINNTLVFNDIYNVDIDTLIQIVNGLKLSDTKVARLDAMVSLLETTKLSDTLVGTFQTVEAVLNGLKYSDNMLYELLILKTMADAYKLGETWASNLAQVSQVTDTYELSDAEVATLILNQARIDGTEYSDTFLSLLGVPVAVDDEIILSDTQVARIIALASLLETYKLSDSFVAGINLAAIQSEAHKLGETWSSNMAQVSQMTNGYKLGETYSLLHLFGGAISNATLLSDLYLTTLIGHVIQAEGLVLSDLQSSQLQARNTITNVIQTGSSFNNICDFAKALTDAHKLSDAWSVFWRGPGEVIYRQMFSEIGSRLGARQKWKRSK